jgi:hypothetical protein
MLWSGDILSISLSTNHFPGPARMDAFTIEPMLLIPLCGKMTGNFFLKSTPSQIYWESMISNNNQ